MEQAPFFVRTCGLVDGPARTRAGLPPHSTPGTLQGDVMLTVVLSGSGTYVNGHENIAVGPGMVGIVEPDDAGVLFSSAHDPYKHYYCRFAGAYAYHLARRIVELRGERFKIAQEYLVYAERVRKMGFLHSKNGIAVRHAEMGHRELLLAEILVELHEALTTDARSVALDDRTAVLNYLHERADQQISVSHAAHDFGVSRNTLMRRVKALFGESLVRLHEQVRIEWAVALLESGRFTVREVAERVGYASADYFARAFKRQRGCPPSQWRGS
jgi:AraC-like DNA-binding protein